MADSTRSSDREGTTLCEHAMRTIQRWLLSISVSFRSLYFVFLIAGCAYSSYEDNPKTSEPSLLPLQDELLEEEDRVHWIDPANMLTFDEEFSALAHKKSKSELRDSAKKRDDIKELRISLAQCRSDLAERAAIQRRIASKDTENRETLCQSEVALFKDLLRKLVSRIPARKGPKGRELRYIGKLEIWHREVTFFEEILSLKVVTSKDLADALFKLGDALSAVDFVRNDDLEETDRFPGQSAILSALPYVNLVVLTAVAVYQVNLLFRRTFVHIVVWLFLTCFALSFIWTWYHVYTVKVAESMARMHKVTIDSCKHPSEHSPWTIFKSYVSGVFGAVQDDPCFIFQKAMTVDPFWEVKPLQVLAITVTEFFLEPLEILGLKFNRFYRALSSDLSLLHQTIVFSCFVILFIIILLFVCGYQFRCFAGLLSLAPPVRRTALPLQEEAATPKPVEEAPEAAIPKPPIKEASEEPKS